MTTINHAVGGGLLYGWIATLFGVSTRRILIYCIIAGALFGALPDVIGWWETYVSDPGSWQLRNNTHDGVINSYGQWTLAWGMHTFLDRFIHPYPEYAGLYKVFEIMSWLLYLMFGFWLYLRHRHAA